MLRFAWWSLRGRWGRLLPLCCGLLCIVVCTTLLAGFTRLTTLTTDRQLRRSWRASYDLLVRAPDAISAVERQLQVIDPAGPEQTYGGISLAQVAQIARIPHVQVVAPEAVVGWLPLRTYIPITFTRAGVYRIITRLDDATQSTSEQQTFVVLPLAAYVKLAGQQNASGISYVPLDTSGKATVAATWSLSTLLVGIDPAAEGQLVGLRWQPSSAHARDAGLPLLMDIHPWSALSATMTVEASSLSPSLLSASQSVNDDMFVRATWAVLQRRQLDAPSFLSLLARELAGREQGSALTPVQGGGVIRYARVGYSVAQASSANGTAPVLSVSGDDSGGNLTRLPLLPQTSTPWVMLDGGHGSFATFDATTLPVWHTTASSATPLGLYKPEPGELPTSLFPQQSLATWPPLLFTTLQAACALTGNLCVSAVRVRVSGLDGFGPRSEALLQQVASDIEERTGLHVDILDGASAEPITVQMATAGGPNRTLTALWIVPHAAVSIATGVNLAAILLLVAMLCVTALALLAAALLAAGSRKADMRLLARIGWSGGRLLVEAALEAAMTALLAACPAWAIAFLLQRVGAPPVSPVLLAWLLTAGTLLYIMVYVMALRNIRPAQPARNQKLKARSHPESDQTRSYAGMVGHAVGNVWWWVILWRQMRWRKGSTLLVLVAVVGACGLVGLLALVQWGLDGLLATTLLGQQVEVSLSAIHLLTALLVCACASFTAGMVLLLAARERRRESGLLLAIGWTGRAVALEMMCEGLLPGLVGGCTGGLLAVLLFLSLYHSWSLSLFTAVIAGTALLGALLCASGSAYPALLTARLLPKRVLSEE